MELYYRLLYNELKRRRIILGGEIMINIEKVGKQIYTLRKAKGLSQEALADILNVSPQAISKWENSKALPETATLPLLAKALGSSIDNILEAQELQILSAIYTDGQTELDLTQYLNKFIIGNEINIPVNEQMLNINLPGDRLKYLVVTYQNSDGIFFDYIKKGDNFFKTAHSRGYEVSCDLEYLFAAYGNEKTYMDAMQKLEHYKYFRWNSFTANDKLFPSPPDNDGVDYLSIVYKNENGISVISCIDGEQIIFNNSRTELIREERGHDYLIIEDVRVLGFGKGMDCSWAGALFTALESMGEQTTYETVMGVSGACWRIAFTPVWDYSSVDGLVAYDYATPGYKAYGYNPIRSECADKKVRKMERQKILKSIKNKKPPIAINLRVAPEWGVITGYLDNGKRLLCRTYYDEEIFNKKFSTEKELHEFQEEMNKTNRYLYVDNWPFIILHFDEKGVVPSHSENFINSLKIKLDSMSITENRGYKMGYGAFEAWIEGLLDEDWFRHADNKGFARRLSVNHFCMLALVDARRSAAAYLNRSVDLFNGPIRDLILEMVDVYAEISSKLSVFFGKVPDDSKIITASPSKVWTEDLRRTQADILRGVVELERQGDQLAEKIIRKAKA